MPDAQQPGGQIKLIKLSAPAFLILLALKLHFATVLDLYSDEIFYWLESTRPALAYSDLPFMSALLAGLGNALAPGSTLAVRSLFLLLGSAIPLLVYWLASAAVPSRQAREAGALALCLPLGGFLGLLAVPDVPLIFFGLLATGSFLRALQDNHWPYWIATGVFVALGLCTHYRFLLYPAAVFLFLLLMPSVRSCWSNGRFWAAVCIAAIGLYPVLWFNFSEQLASASFYLIERHPWEFQAMGLAHVFKQAGLVTPPLYALLLYTLWLMWNKAKQGSLAAALLLSLSLTNLLVYLVLAPWTDARSTSIHWPLSGYFPILVFVPSALRELVQRLSNKYPIRRLRLAVSGAIALGFLGSIVAVTGVGSQAYQSALQSLIGPGVLSNKMAGWEEFATFTETTLQSEFAGEQPLLIADNYYTAAQLQFAGFTNQVYTLDREKAVRDGRMHQLELWEMDAIALQEHLQANQPALFITEDSTLEVEAKAALIDNSCNLFAALTALSQLDLFNGDKQFSFYRATSHSSASPARAAPCPWPMRAWIDQPVSDSTVSGEVTIAGWAYSEEIGIESVTLLLDGKEVVALNYGDTRPDVVEVMNVTSDPNSPELGYSGLWDSSTVENGWYRLELAIRNAQGSILRYGQRRIRVAN